MRKIEQKTVGICEVRKYAYDIESINLSEEDMSKKAKTLTASEVRRVLDYVSTRKHALRNRALVMTTFLSGMRVGEVASLRYKDVIDSEGSVRKEILLTADMTKGDQARVVYVNEKLRKEFEQYLKVMTPEDMNTKFFYSQKRKSDGFTPNTLTQFFHFLYRRAGIDGASSHSGRRTFITELASKGVSVRVLMNLAGHRNIGTTQAYIDVNDNMLRSAVELV